MVWLLLPVLITGREAKPPSNGLRSAEKDKELWRQNMPRVGLCRHMVEVLKNRTVVNDGGTNAIPNAAQANSNPSGRIDPRTIAIRMDPFR